MDNESDQITQHDITMLQEYLKESKELEKRKPRLPKVWDKVGKELMEGRPIPEEYRDRIGITNIVVHSEYIDGKYHYIPEGKTIQAYYDIQMKPWEDEAKKLNDKYHDVIFKVLRITLLSDLEDPERQHLILTHAGGSSLEELGIKELLRQVIKKTLPKVNSYKLSTIDFPLDKVNRDVWGLLYTDEEEKQISEKPVYRRYDVSKKGSKKPVRIQYSIDFTDLNNIKDVSITQKLEPFDKRIYLAIAARFNAGYDMMTIQQIYNDIGYTGRMGQADIDRFNKSITKMSRAQIHIDNQQEIEAGSYSYELFRYDGSLLPMERIQALVNGTPTKAVIHPFREPPLASLARGRKQITTVDIKLLNSPLNKTNSNIALEDYLIAEIARIKKNKRNNRLLYETIFDRVGVNTIKQKQRTIEKIRQLLNYYIECEYIKTFKETASGISIEG